MLLRGCFRGNVERLLSPKAAVKIGEIISSDRFRIDTPSLEFDENELEDYFIYFSDNKDFLITGN